MKKEKLFSKHLLSHNLNIFHLSGCFITNVFVVWLICERSLGTMNNKINRLHERALQIVYNDYKSSFKQLLTKDTSYSVHHLNIHILVKLFNNMTDVYNNFFIRSSQTAINCLVSVRKFEFFQKNILHMHTTSLLLCYLTFSAK